MFCKNTTNVLQTPPWFVLCSSPTPPSLLRQRAPSRSAISHFKIAAAASLFWFTCLEYVHGYNNSFDEAVRRTAMIAFDLDFDGATFLFAWPAQSGMFGYGGDRGRARIAAPFLVELLKLIAVELPDVKLHIIAHSTGAEIALSALTDLASSSTTASLPRFGELILSHADVSAKRLERVMPSIKALGIGATSYSSAEDWAMWISHSIRSTGARVGSGPVYVPG